MGCQKVAHLKLIAVTTLLLTSGVHRC